MKVLKIDSAVTVVTDSGQIITNSNVSAETYSLIIEYAKKNDEAAIKALLVPELCAEERKFVARKKAIETIEQMVEELPHLFTTKNKALFRKNIPSLSIPETLALEFILLYDKYSNANVDEAFEDTPEFKSLDNFWMWCALNPNAESREDLFRFLQHHEMQITNQGMFLAYRRVVSVNSHDKALISFISNKYVHVKTKMKKSPAAYEVHDTFNGYYELKKVDFNSDQDVSYVGNLQDLYLNLPNMVQKQFTDAHTHSMDYRIGVEARILRHEGNQSNQVSCSRGLHVASKAYDYSGFGDTAIVVAVNPMDVLAVPTGEDGKLRTCAFTPIAVLEDSEENSLLADGSLDVSDLLFTHYEEQVSKLAELLDNHTPYELKINNILGLGNSSELISILSNLEEAQEIVNSRVTYI